MEVSFAESYKAEKSADEAAAGTEQHDANSAPNYAKKTSAKVYATSLQRA